MMSFIAIKEDSVTCRDVKVIIPGTVSFIDRKEVNRILLQHDGVLVGRRLNSINIHEIENALKLNPYIRNARVFADMDGTVRIEITQREPVLRILNYTNQDFYVDKDGFKIPASPDYVPRVLVANGDIMEGFSGKVDTLRTKLAKDLFQTALFIEKDSLWSEQIEQMYVNSQKEIELIPRVGDQKILLGDADSLERRFNNLRIFYKKAIPAVGWNAYKTINIKYCNQVICEKNSTDSSGAAAIPAKKEEEDIMEHTEDIIKSKR